MTDGTAQTGSAARLEIDAAGSTARNVGIAAAIIMAGNLTSSLLGFVRQSIMLGVFGDHRVTDAFVAASIIPQMFYDLTVGAAVSAALIPIFTEIVATRGSRSLSGTVGPVLALAWLVLAVVTGVLILVAHPLMSGILATHLGGSTHVSSGTNLAARVLQVLLPSLLFLGTSAVLLATLYSVRRFTIAAFASGFYHLGIIAGALLLARPLGIMALPVGAVVGAAAQAAVQFPSLLRAVGGFRIRFALTPEVRRIVRLYAPVAAGLLVSLVGQVVDLNFKWGLGSGAVAAMGAATALVQFPIGIAVAALSFAILPTISTHVTLGRPDEFKQTLATGLRFVLFLTVPAAVGYLALATPIVALIYQHHKFDHAATVRTATALVGYAIQIPFVGIDQLLIFSFYARKNTVTPMLIGVVGVVIYVVSALLLLPHLHILGLALANTIQNSLHALILLSLLLTTVGALEGAGLIRGIARTFAAALAMGVVAAGSAYLLASRFNGGSLSSRAILVLCPIVLGATCYLGVAALLKSEDLRLLRDISRRAFRPAAA